MSWKAAALCFLLVCSYSLESPTVHLSTGDATEAELTKSYTESEVTHILTSTGEATKAGVTKSYTENEATHISISTGDTTESESTNSYDNKEATKSTTELPGSFETDSVGTTDVDFWTRFITDYISSSVYESSTTQACPNELQAVALEDSNKTSHSVVIKWNENAGESSCFTRYQLNVLNQPSYFIAKNETSFQLEDLAACSSYTVNLIKVNWNNFQLSEEQNLLFRTKKAVPGIVDNLTVVGHKKVLAVKWDKPTKNSNCVDFYNVTWATHSETTTDLFYNITQLRACSSYNVTIYAVNKNKGMSRPVMLEGETPFEEPGQVEDLTVEAQVHNVTLNWKKPRTNKDCVHHYIVEWRVATHENIVGKDATEEETFVIENLDACVEYEVYVKAVNEKDQYLEPMTRTVTTKTEVPGEVNDMIIVKHKKMLEVKWTRPMNSTACIDSYKVVWSTRGSQKSVAEHTRSLSYNIPNLAVCTQYTVAVYAESSDKKLSFPVTIEGTTDLEVPGIVENLSVLQQSNSLSVSWDKPIDNGNCVDHYLIEWKVTSHEDMDGLAVTKNVFYVIKDLIACEQYNLSVRAMNEVNDSSDPKFLITSTATDVPGAIEELVTNSLPHEISLTWQKPSKNDKCVTHYFVEWRASADGSDSYNETVSSESYVIGDLEACLEYDISVRAMNEDGSSSDPVPKTSTTESDVPGVIEELFTNSLPHKISLTWQKPSKNDKCVTHYFVEWRASADGSDSYNETVSSESYVIGDLEACLEYDISVRAMNKDGSSLNPVPKTSTTESDVPGEVNNLTVEEYEHVVIVKWSRPSQNVHCVQNYEVNWWDPTDDSRNGSSVGNESFKIYNLKACVDYEVSVTAVNIVNDRSETVRKWNKTKAELTGPPKHKRTSFLETESAHLIWTLPDLNYNKCELQNCTVVCTSDGLPIVRTTSETFENDTIVVNVIGLTPSTTYSCVASITNELGPSENSSIVYITTEDEVQVGMIVGILIGILAVGIIAVVFVTYRKGVLGWPPKMFSGAKQTTVRPQSILLKKFPAFCVQMLETPMRLANEYQLLQTLSADISASNSCDNGRMPENRRKNRYANILPYDATRVTLDLIDGDPTSHYINASFIKGYTNDIEYIASQGPKEDTCADFWRMVFQHDVRVIVMVTNLVEQEIVKCHQYYPNLRENVVYGDMTIRCTTEIKFPIHTARTLVLVKGDRKRTLSHLHFRQWPDFGVPQSTDLMIQFCQTMRHHAFAAELGLILVHCSAGVGRTGTLIAVDILLQHICENKKVDIFGTVFKLRKQRTNMVQTEGQYTYIYRCIKDAIEDPTIVNQENITNNSLEPIYENVGTSLNTLHYEKLPKVSSKNSSSESECEL